MKVQLEPGVWLTEGDGDPPRTTVEANATEFTTQAQALKAIQEAREYRKFPRAVVVEDWM